MPAYGRLLSTQKQVGQQRVLVLMLKEQKRHFPLPKRNNNMVKPHDLYDSWPILRQPDLVQFGRVKPSSYAGHEPEAAAPCAPPVFLL